MSRTSHIETRGRYASAAAVAACLASAATGSTPNTPIAATGGPRHVSAASLPTISRVDERYQAYNVESVEVTGGNFWAPYPQPGQKRSSADVGPHGVEFATGDYQKRTPIDLTNRRLITLTKALGPSYMRVSGSWANSIYFQDDDKPAITPPPGYQGVMTRAQWAGVVAFGKAVNAKILTSFATSKGAKLPDGSWNPEGARRLFAYTKTLGSQIDSVELMNEPNVARPAYNEDNYARDTAALRQVINEMSPKTKLVGPAATGEAGFKLFDVPPKEASTERLMSGIPKPTVDIFSHHFYGAVSERCKSMSDMRGGAEVTTSRAEALSEVWLSRADQAQRFYSAVRDKVAPGAPMWVTETAQTACGGDRWSATFLDTFRYVDQLGRLARQGLSISFHNTLAASDYALIDDRTWMPRPNYWAALLWRRTMGEIVLDAGANESQLHVYAHCLKGKPGGVGLVAVNLDRSAAAAITLASAAERYTLTSKELESGSVDLNGRTLAMPSETRLPTLTGIATRAGAITLAPTSITFFAIPKAGNGACR